MAIFREIVRAEKEWNDFINNEPGALSATEIFKYWNNYMLAYIEELQYQPICYFLMSGYVEYHDEDEWIGVYDSISELQKDYFISVEALKIEHDYYADRSRIYTNNKVIIHTFNKVTKEWRFDVPADEIFTKRVRFNEKDKNKDTTMDSEDRNI